MKSTRNLLLTATALFGLTTAGAAAADAAEAEVVGLMFYADSCGSCKVLDPKIEAAKPAFKDQPVLFVKFDHSDEATKNQAALLASSLKVDEVYAAQEKASGFMLLLDADTNEVRGKLTREMSESEIEEAIDSALAES